MRYAMIMAGGAGTRLWPMSRASLPKQLIPLLPGASGERQSLLAIAAGRMSRIVDTERRFICTGEKHRAAIRAALPDFDDRQILGEPAARDTVNAVGFAAAVFEKQDPDAVFAVLTADHVIEPDDVFEQAMDTGYKLVEQDPSRLVTFGIKPTYPATGFGYVEQGAHIPGAPDTAFRVARFVEKPELPRAQVYFESGDFFWNAGMFIFHAGTFMKLLERYKPESAAGLRRIQEAWDTPDQQRVLGEVYPELPKISVDYAIMEPAAEADDVSICGVRMDVNWLDIGSWPSFGERLKPDAAGNRVSASRTALTDSTNNLVVSSSDAHTVALLGCENLIVVHTPEATLVMPADRAQDLKSLHAQLPDELK